MNVHAQLKTLRLPVLLSLLVAGAACKSAPSRRREPIMAGQPSLDVQRLTLRVSPLEVAASGVRGHAEMEETISIKNVSQNPMVIMRIVLVGDGGDVFTLTSAPAVSRTLMPGQGIDVGLKFAPAPTAAPGVHRCTLQIHLGPDDDLGPLVDVAGLVTTGQSAAEEPPLADVAAALGFAIDVGAQTLILPAGPAPQGDEVSVPRFVRAKPGAIAVDPVARFSGDGAASYGIYRTPPAGPAFEPLAELAGDQHQSLHPEWVGEGRLSFDPGDEPFGVFVRASAQTIHSEARLNRASLHAARTYPLRARNGEAIADAYLVAFETTPPIDFQDFVFVLWNVRPAN